MSKSFTTSFLAAAATCAALAIAQGASAATEERLTKTEILKLNECMAMTSDVLAKDGQCTTVMRKASLTSSDIEKMRRCESKMNVDVTKDPDCAAMIKKHPDLVRGHGSLMPQEESKEAPK
ncbi:MAG: hypothetical protein AB7E79_01460 [Rhodospirillaceae bacterium]